MYSMYYKTPSPQELSVLEKEQPSRPLIVDLDHYPELSPDLKDSPPPQKIPPHDLIKEVKDGVFDTFLKLQRKATPWLIAKS